MLPSLGVAVALNSQLGRAASMSAAGIVNGFTGAIGNTPLIRIPSLSAQTGCNILGKAEVSLLPPVSPRNAAFGAQLIVYAHAFSLCAMRSFKTLEGQ